MTDTITIPRALLEQVLEALEHEAEIGNDDAYREERDALRSALEQPQQEPVLQDIEQYRMQMAGICTAAVGYWKPEDGIHPDYDTPAIREVANLYAKYREAVAALEQPQHVVQHRHE